MRISTVTALAAALTLCASSRGQTVPIRINSGGWGYTSPSGLSWDSDNFYSGGSTDTRFLSIWDTTDQVVYKSCRLGDFTYRFSSIPNGSYNVTLKFAELSYSSSGQRVFNVAINGSPVLANFDIVQAAGGAQVATDRKFSVSVATGTITISFSSVIGQAQVNGIEITSSASVPAPAPPPTPTPGNQKPVGQLQAVSATGVVSGWARDPDSTAAPIQVQLYVDYNAGSASSTAPAAVPQPPAPGTTLLSPDGSACRTDLIAQHQFAVMLPTYLACASINRHFTGQLDYRGTDGKCYHADWTGTVAVACSSSVVRPYLPNGQIPSPFDAAFDWIAASGRCYYTAGDTGLEAAPYGVSSEKICGIGGNDPRAESHTVVLLSAVNGGSSTVAPVATVSASELRSDVGNHGFSVQLPLQFADGKTHQVWAWGVDLTDGSGASNTQLPGSPISFTMGSTPTPTPTPTPVPTGLLSFVTPSDGQSLTGLAPVTVSIASALDANTLTMAVDSAIPKALYWSGAGYGVLLNTEKMNDGAHTLTLSARDYTGQTYTARITVIVANASTPVPVPVPVPIPTPTPNPNPTPTPTPAPTPTPTPTPVPNPGQSMSFTEPLNGQILSGLAGVSVEIKFALGSSDPRLRVDQSPTTSSMHWNGSGFGSLLNTTRMSNGAHSLTATAEDASGNSYTATITIQVAN